METTLASNTIPAGGTEATSFDVKEAWYPVAYLDDLDKTKPTTFTLLEIDLVLWWDAKSQSWRAFVDQCPHRLASLSEGRINEQGLLECPYHGWSFSGSGNCEDIPQQSATNQANTSKRACATAYPTQTAQGLLFVYPGKAAMANQVPVPIVEPIEESPEEWVCLDLFRDLPYDALTLLENVLDVSHVPYTHHKTVSKRSNAAPVDLAVTQSDKNGFQGVWEEGPRKGELGTQYTSFIAPSLMWHDLTSKQFGRTLTVVYATPIRKGQCRLFARFPFKFASPIPAFFIKLTPRWYSHVNQHTVLEDDQIFLHHQERYLEAKGGSDNYSKAFYLATKADLYVSELRQWVNLYHADPFPNEKLPPALLKEQLLERYHSHTKNCASCRQALKNIQKLKLASGLVGAISLSLSPILSVVFASASAITQRSASLWLIAMGTTSGIAIIAIILWWQLGKLERKFYQGMEIPPRNKG
ncbi:ring-hydroxylating dioxygenase, large terminal subunit [Xenococcus sp. PCC 7305]|uniref:aromatic ring-hydroxylating dioxygenase subunit alpha n=1 Tax=Xenococcus sp. PCC 7305 TaxID=102125 RepID=UPI0002ABCA16|nr:Rieske 2Fe-2S domain-containing protein [Xenococcus sp. PCC 7305]ELS05613.1 ring-hydroxylating dioxygenase, large terminal subunit [Xenococcus sp. PCC 7305]